MGVARIFFFQKIVQKIFKKYSKNFQKKLKNFRKFLKIFLRKMLKMHYYSRVFPQFNKALGQFLRVWTKNTNCLELLRKFWNFLMKILKKNWFSLFFYFFENLLLKIELSEITPFFNNIFFLFGFGGISPFLLATPLVPIIIHFILCLKGKVHIRFNCKLGLFRDLI